MNPLFERLSLQGHLRRIIDQYGDQGWQIIRHAIELELEHTILSQRDDSKTPH